MLHRFAPSSRVDDFRQRLLCGLQVSPRCFGLPALVAQDCARAECFRLPAENPECLGAVAKHAHPHAQRLQVLHGRLEVRTRTRTILLNPGDRSFLAANRPHATIGLADTWLISVAGE